MKLNAAALLILLELLLLEISVNAAGDDCTLEILHPVDGQQISMDWQDILIATSSCDIPAQLLLHIDGHIVASMASGPVAALLTRLEDGQHDMALTLVDEASRIIAQQEVTVTYLHRPSAPSVFHFPQGFTQSLENESRISRTDASERGDGGLHVIWTCPDWEVDWVTELLQGTDEPFKIVFDDSFTYFADNALVVISQNDERNRHPAQVGTSTNTVDAEQDSLFYCPRCCSLHGHNLVHLLVSKRLSKH
jgi:hypothetical protein